jgi:conjugative transposon TraM protein
MNNEKENIQENLSVEQTAPPQQEKPEKSEKENASRQLSLQDREKLKKGVIFAALGIVFVVSIWWIFAPSAEEKKKTEEQAGLNDVVPQASNLDLSNDKLKAYTLGTDEENEINRQGMIGNLYDYFDRESEKNESLLSADDAEDDDPVAKSVNQYQETTRMLQSFNEPPAYDPEKEELWREVDELRSKIDEMEDAQNEKNDQLALMEKSYEMAAKYLPQAPATPVNPFETAVERPMDGTPVNAHVRAEAKEPVLTVYPDAATVVSALYQEVSDSIFMAEQLQERNRHFFSAEQTSDDIPDKNTLKVSVYETVTLKDGETVRLRLLEAARVANMFIPRNTLFTAIARIQGNRLSLTVTSIEYRERIIAVNLTAYDTDGQQGVFIPNSLEANAAREIAAGMGQSAGTSFTFSSSAGQQIAADAGRGLLQGTSQYFGNKMREVKVTLKSGHRLFLKAS